MSLFNPTSDLERKIASLVCVYSIDVCEKEVDPPHEHFTEYREFLFVCIQFHAEQAGKVGAIEIDIIHPLQEGRSPIDGSSLGGNPLRDGVLATAMLTKETKAVLVFEEDYFAYLKEIAYRVQVRFGNDPHEWWNEFLDFLAGYTSSNGKLRNFQGKCALRHWLRVVLWNFLRSLLRREPSTITAAELSEDIPMQESSVKKIELQESIEVFRSLVREAVKTLTHRERLLLSMIHIDKVRKKDIAAVFQVHPGQIGRWEEAAIAQFRSELDTRLENLRDKNIHEELMGGLVNTPKDFAEAFCDILKQVQIANTEQ